MSCNCEELCPRGGLGKCDAHYCAWCCGCALCRAVDLAWQKDHAPTKAEENG